MATRKIVSRKTPAKTAAKTANRWAKVQVPEGFKPIASGEFGEPWDHENQPVLTGQIVGDVRTAETGRGRDRRETRVVSIMDEDTGRMTDVWESASLKGWFDKLADGLRVCVVFQGYRDVGKQSPMKVMLGSIDAADMPDDEPARPAANKTRTRR